MVVLFKIKLPLLCTIICPPAFTYTMQLFSTSVPFTKNVPATKIDFAVMVSVPANIVLSAQVVSVFEQVFITFTQTLSFHGVSAGEVTLTELNKHPVEALPKYPETVNVSHS